MNIRSTITSFGAAAGMTFLILDNRTAIAGAVEGIDICIKTLIPSLFPFFVLSILLTGSILGRPVNLLRPVARLCRIPEGCESLLAIGFLGGYPVGAQNVAFARESGVLSSKDAGRMIVFCNNAGPAFMFGFLSQMFQNPICPWLLWMIHMSSAIVLGFLLPGGGERNVAMPCTQNLTFSHALDKSIKVMARVCGWVILFRIILEFLQRSVLNFLPVTGQVLVAGLLELSNGCLWLRALPSEGLKFILSAVMLSFGGMCVYLQTRSIAANVSMDLYIPGKMLQGCISFLLSYGVQFLLFSGDRIRIDPIFVCTVLILTMLAAVFLRNLEKSVAISGKILYNEKSCEKRRILCCSGKKSKNPAPTAFTAPN